MEKNKEKKRKQGYRKNNEIKGIEKIDIFLIKKKWISRVSRGRVEKILKFLYIVKKNRENDILESILLVFKYNFFIVIFVLGCLEQFYYC